jgi:teichuronic acid biosynthesis glycosyltransferase TuaG
MEHTDNNIDFSVVIPVFNGAGTICRAIDSVLEQTYQPLEIIVVDDASRDDTVSLIQGRYGDRVVLLQCSMNKGSGDARNVGMDVAMGAYIAFLDADDSWQRQKLAYMADAIAARPNDALIYHNYTLADVGELEMPRTVTPTPVSFARLIPRNKISTSCAVVRNDPAFRFLPGMRYTEDYELWLRILYGRSASFVPLPLTQLYRGITTPGGISSNTWRMRKGELTCYSRLPALNTLFVFIVPLLWCYSIFKHIGKQISS